MLKVPLLFIAVAEPVAPAVLKLLFRFRTFRVLVTDDVPPVWIKVPVPS
jgi:hypothetical protein